jgi:hypothetical protein
MKRANGIASGDLAAIERMIDEGGPVCSAPSAQLAPAGHICPRCGGKKTWHASRCSGCARRGPHPKPFARRADPSSEERLAERRAALRPYRLYCFACGRSSEVATVLARPGRCTTCGGTMLTEDLL